MMNIYKAFYTGLFYCLLVSSVQAEQVSQTALDRQVMAISEKLRCAVCQNQPVSESNSGLAQDMRASVREQLQAGKTEAEVIDFFVARYGDYILIKPKKTGIGLPLWVLPPVLLVFVSFFAFMAFKTARQESVADGRAPELSEEDKQRVRQARENNNKQGAD